MPLKGKVQCIDWCIHQIVAALNAGGVETRTSCCGHRVDVGFIELEDERMLLILDWKRPKDAEDFNALMDIVGKWEEKQ